MEGISVRLTVWAPICYCHSMDEKKVVYPPCFINAVSLLRLAGSIEKNASDEEKERLKDDIAEAKMALHLYEVNWEILNRDINK